MHARTQLTQGLWGMDCSAFPYRIFGAAYVERAMQVVHSAICAGEVQRLAGTCLGRLCTPLQPPWHVPHFVCGMQPIHRPNAPDSVLLLPFEVVDYRLAPHLVPQQPSDVLLGFAAAFEVMPGNASAAAAWLSGCIDNAQQYLPPPPSMVRPGVGRSRGTTLYAGLGLLAALLGLCLWHGRRRHMQRRRCHSALQQV